MWCLSCRGQSCRMSGSRTTSCPKTDLQNTDLQEPGQDFSCIGSIQIDAVADFVWALVATLWAAGLLSMTKIYFSELRSLRTWVACVLFFFIKVPSNGVADFLRALLSNLWATGYKRMFEVVHEILTDELKLHLKP